jgi:serine/threonine protein kinase
MFNPTLRTRLIIDAQEFRFSPHPAVPTLVWGQEGRHAIVYQVKSDGGGAYALKVFRPAFRHPGLIDAADTLWTYHELPGMRVCQQRVITRETHPELVAEYEDLDYAMMMPWIEGRTWFDYLQTRQRLTLDESRAVAESMAWVLYALEINNLAHCDLSSGNAIVDPRLDQIHLVDVEDLYSPWVEPPPMIPAGSMGYQHPSVSSTGQWGPLGDRFAGAILMAEMLGWAHPDVRRAAWGESYFAPEEIQQESERYEVLTDALRVYDGAFTDVFEETWWADSLETCPPLKTWYDLLDALPREPVARWAPVDEALFEEEVPTPPEIAVGAAPTPSQPPVRLRRCILLKPTAVQRQAACPSVYVVGGPS